MVKIVVVQTEASGETVTLLQAQLLAQAAGFLQIVANRWKHRILRISIGNRRNMSDTLTVR